MSCTRAVPARVGAGYINQMPKKTTQPPAVRPRPGALSLLGSGERRYPKSPEEARLETFANPAPGRPYRITFDCPEFTSLCPITGQPDFASISIEYIPNRFCLESKALKLYLFAFRNQGCFAETIVNRILDDLAAACRPRWMAVTGNFTARGGIRISVRAERGRPPSPRA